MWSHLDLWIALVLFVVSIFSFHLKMRSSLTQDIEDLRQESAIYEEWELMEAEHEQKNVFR